ncbi:TPA: hypothetical protein ACX3EQ_004639, partial [Vibrio parahaemolyticus]
LRGEQRNTEAAAYHLKHLNQRMAKNATRCESLLNSLLARKHHILYLQSKNTPHMDKSHFQMKPNEITTNPIMLHCNT